MQWDLLDFFDKPSQSTSMARTTAFPCAIVARMIASGKWRRPGVFTPEFLGPEPGLLEHVLAEHERRGVHYARRAG
jgi:saccharopine dehydrogenase-like NADP-dependent oxidoreductase